MEGDSKKVFAISDVCQSFSNELTTRFSAFRTALATEVDRATQARIQEVRTAIQRYYEKRPE